MTAAFGAAAQPAPYPPSPAIKGIEWHWDTRQTAAPGSDLWPMTWGPDGNLYLSWGDGGGFGGTDSDGRVSMGFARLEGGPEHFQGFNVNGGKNPEHPASFPKKGKTGALLFDQGILYTCVNLQDGKWPDVNHILAWSTNKGASWARCDWLFPKGEGHFQPARFLNFGQDGAGAPDYLEGYAYLYGVQQASRRGESKEIFLSRVPHGKILEQGACEFFSGLDESGQPVWNRAFTSARPIFTDTNGVAPAGMAFDPGLGCFLLSSYHTGPGQLGIFEARRPWGPWFTAAYYDAWGGMGREGEGLTCEFPRKWMSEDGRTVWAIFSVYGAGAKEGIRAHDRFNLVKVTLSR
ncbi:MAG TPA: DUF4185 domain-containing protein [Verrucomicrobiae bacterium]